jgi:SAM-dependent methyltransferase
MQSRAIPNAYDDGDRAAAYADLGFAGTYYLAFRDLPDLITRHVDGNRALDFGCGAGRSTRFLKELGFDAVGIDVAEPMLRMARERDPAGTYVLVRDDAATGWPDGPFDLALASFPFDNIADLAHRRRLLGAIRQRLAPAGRLILIASAPELYVHEWLSFTTKLPATTSHAPATSYASPSRTAATAGPSTTCCGMTRRTAPTSPTRASTCSSCIARSAVPTSRMPGRPS